MVDSELINRFVLTPLMLEKNNNLNSNLRNLGTKISKAENLNLQDYIYSQLMPQNSLKMQHDFVKIIEGVNSGNCALFVDTLAVSFDIDVKGFKQRSITSPNNEVIINGPQEAFVENLRTNTSILSGSIVLISYLSLLIYI